MGGAVWLVWLNEAGKARIGWAGFGQYGLLRQARAVWLVRLGWVRPSRQARIGVDGVDGVDGLEGLMGEAGR